jgi:hypothetical protein
MKSLLPAALITLLWAAPALAQEAPVTRVDIRDNALSASALNGSPTLTIDLGTRPSVYSAWSKARLGITYTYSAATTVTTVFACAIDGTNFTTVTSRSISGGTATVSTLTDSIATGAGNLTYQLEYDIRGCKKAKWTFGGASAGAGDLVTVDVALVAGK